ncbi:D-galactose 1-dehydrogenase [Rhizomicrobium palustre]|uniref:D-galactose 1-dehydrogenase n=1 Tax=Rhizomicrobium palustre TaxID=189966 RepID=A0A846N0U9_9PROT|nr:D-galactose 1-dehydrogenase [Rhizomicrobium palustre]
MQPVRVGIVGLGKIARDEHVPALKANDAFELVAATSTHHNREDMPVFARIEEMLDAVPEIGAVSICTPPQAHYAPAKAALLRGKHVLLEKPPTPTLAEFEELTALAAQNGVTLFQTWHARETPAIAAATEYLSTRQIKGGKVVWKEDVRHWHPGQDWIWSEGGFGVLDAGINAISILTEILPEPMTVEAAHFLVPSNMASPIAVAVAFALPSGAVIDVEFDFRHRGIQTRTVHIETDAGPFDLARFSAAQGEAAWGEVSSQRQEYAALYQRFATLIKEGRSDTDKRPLELVLDIFRDASRSTVEAFRE